jgi:hypothetical protein
MLQIEHQQQQGRRSGAADWSALQAAVSPGASMCREAIACVGRSCSRPAATRGMHVQPYISTQHNRSDVHLRFSVLKLTGQRVQDGERLERLLARAQQAAEDAHCDAARANAAAADARAQLAARPVDSHQAMLLCHASVKPLWTLLCLHMLMNCERQAQPLTMYLKGHAGDISAGSRQRGKGLGGTAAGGARHGACAAQAGAQAWSFTG